MNGTSTVEKEWAAIDGDELVEKANTRIELREKLYRRGLDPDDYEIAAVPKPYRSFWI